MDKKIKFEYLDHTADVIIKAYGKNFSEALSNSILALSNLCIDIDYEIKKINEKFKHKLINKKIIVKSFSKESLFYDLLNEIIFIIDTEFMSPIFIENIKFENYKQLKNEELIFSADLKCINVKGARIKGSVKSATYNNMQIIEKNNLIMVQTVVDI
jgi:SHS2 domain-containing protein